MIVRNVAASLVFGASLLVFGSAGTAHAHGTHAAPIEPQVPILGTVRTHQGPYSVLHQQRVRGPFSVLHEGR